MAMFTLPQMIARLTKGFVKVTGRMPDGLEKIKIKQEALERIKQQNKVVDMEGNVIDTSKGIMGGRQVDKFISKNKIKKRPASEDRALEDFVDDAGGVNPDDPRGIDDFIPDPEDMADGGRAGFDNGGAPSIKLFPRASGRQVEGEVGPGLKISERDLNYGITGLLQGNKFFGGAEIDKGKVKIDVLSPEGDTLFKDTIGKKDAVNFILGMGDPTGEKFQIKTDKNFDNVQFVLKKSFAEGGRIGYKIGSVDKARRAFLKTMGAAGAGIGALKMGLLKLAGKEGARQVTKQIIKTDPVPGKPAWFDALVTKVVNEGDDVTKRFATGERQTVHMKKLDDDTTVMVTQDLDDGAIRVEYESPDNVFGDPVQLQYKKSLPDEGDPRPTAEFTTAESGPVGRQQSPDDYEIEIDEVGGNSIEDLTSDLSKLKQYATGKKPTLKEFVQNKKRKDKAQRISEDPEARMDDVIRRQGEMLDDQDFASGGLAGMLGE